jgi:hypothetical protein
MGGLTLVRTYKNALGEIEDQRGHKSRQYQLLSVPSISAEAIKAVTGRILRMPLQRLSL